jgi:branched-chain amino acid transport system substrate-binding protein
MMQTLVATPGITAVVGAVAGADAEAMSLLAEQHSVPMLSLSTDTAVPPTLMPGRPQFVFLLGPSSLDVMAVLLNTIGNLHRSKIMLLRTDDTYGQDGENAFLTLGGKLIAPGHTNIVRIDPAGKDPSAYSRAAHTVVTDQADAVIVWGLGPVAGRVARALRAANYTGALLFDPGAASDETINGDNHAAVNHAYVVAPRILAGPGFAATTPIAVDRQNFFDSYTLKHPVFSGLAVYGGDAVKLVAQAAIKAKSTDVLNVRQALTDLACEGIAGSYDFGSSNSGALTRDSLTVFQIDIGGWEPLTA